MVVSSVGHTKQPGDTCHLYKQGMKSTTLKVMARQQ